MKRNYRIGFASVLAAIASFVAGCSTTANQEKNMLGYGYQVVPVSDTIYRIQARSGFTQTTDVTRSIVMMKAADLAISKGYSKFAIVAGDGFSKESRSLRAGPVPIPLPSEPTGSLVIKFLPPDTPDGDAYDARAEKAKAQASLIKAGIKV